ncbi:hypothetical protein [Sphingobacterium sp. IITKGP-BTPF85]|uniref:hypothetical protein n=1 Tax=Sphingobacterium sp. IITKGP-BTPF85 TaxID=1338009 RepID=UPI000639B402|nr:hypothetical protein [Sphingobacterium sp. IITKGP-BTPF85]KKX52217.1 hypothetical protein L950_0200525 [Sphingobacterium sp. IITKGP-BTPF85]
MKFYDLDTCMVGHLEDPVVGGIQYKGYHIHLSDLPGIGADINQEFLDSCERWVI